MCELEQMEQISDFINEICMVGDGGRGGCGMLQLRPVKKYLIRINYASKKLCFGKHIDFKHEQICPYESQYSFIRGFLRFPKFTMSLTITFHNISAYIFYSAWLENLMVEHSNWRDCNYTDEKQKTKKYLFLLDTNPQPHYLAEGLAHSRLASWPSDQLVLNRAVK